MKVIIGLNSTCENKHSMPKNNKTLFCVNLDMPIKCLVVTMAKINSNFVYKFKKVPPNVPLRDELPLM